MTTQTLERTMLPIERTVRDVLQAMHEAILSKHTFADEVRRIMSHYIIVRDMAIYYGVEIEDYENRFADLVGLARKEKGITDLILQEEQK